MEPLRIGVLGAARISRLAIAGPARATGDRLVAVATRDRSRAEAFAATHGVERVAGGYAYVLADPEVEVVYNPLANSLHGPWNLAAVAAGKHVLTEKPSASNATEAADVRAAAATAGVTVLEAFHYLHHPVTRRLLELLGSGELGELRRVEVAAVIPAPADGDPAGRSSWPAAPSWTSAATPSTPTASSPPGPAAHPASSPPAAASAPATPASTNGWRPISSSPTAPPAPPRCNMAGDQDRWPFRIVGTHGEATAANFVQPHVDDRVLVSSRHGDRVEELGRRSSYTYQLEALRAHLRDGVPLPVDPDDAVDTMTLIDACYEAAGFTPRPPGPTG